MNKELMEFVKENNLLLMDGFDDCICGIGYRVNESEKYVVYNTKKVLFKLMNEHHMSYDEAIEFHEFNQACAWVGDKTPGFVDTFNI